MTIITIIGWGVVLTVGAGLALIAVTDLPGLERPYTTAQSQSSGYDPYAAEARAYQLDRDAA